MAQTPAVERPSERGVTIEPSPASPRRPRAERAARIGTAVGLVLGLGLFLTFGAQWFPPKPGEVNLNYVLGAAVVGAGSAFLGSWVGRLVARFARK
jgi:hypothetical protein